MLYCAVVLEEVLHRQDLLLGGQEHQDVAFRLLLLDVRYGLEAL